MKTEIPDWMIIDAVRYCIGRQSYQVAETAGWLVDNWDGLWLSVKNTIMRDLERAFDSGNLGQTCDRREWERVRALWTEPKK
jgi:hypothetical protein